MARGLEPREKVEYISGSEVEIQAGGRKMEEEGRESTYSGGRQKQDLNICLLKHEKTKNNVQPMKCS